MHRSLLLLAASANGDKAADLITELPGFPESSSWGFKAYSGFIDVPGPIAQYDSLKVHYQFHTSQRNPDSDPVAIWHQGGPGGSSINTGLFGEMGVFQVGDKAHGKYLNPYAWNKIANMLYLDSPAGSGVDQGYSQCLKDGKAVTCSWNDRTQAEAYAHTLMAFFTEFPEFAKNDFFLTGESYFGQYGPNIAHFILNNAPFNAKINLKGIAAGNACWGGTETCVACNGPSQDKIDVDLFFGKGLFSPSLKRKIDSTCKFPSEYKPGTDSGDPFDCDAGTGGNKACDALMKQMRTEVGPHNVYNIYDNCEHTQQFLTRSGKDMTWLTQVLRTSLHNVSATRRALTEMNGGYAWDCGGDVGTWITSSPIKKALHLDGVTPGASGFEYKCSGPASITLWPELSQKIRVLIYNGDADACVPYNGNEDWVLGLEASGVLEETQAWTPWFASNKVSPAGYTTKYRAIDSEVDFTFKTIRLAGHMAPQFQPDASLAMISDFFAGSSRRIV